MPGAWCLVPGAWCLVALTIAPAVSVVGYETVGHRHLVAALSRTDRDSVCATVVPPRTVLDTRRRRALCDRVERTRQRVAPTPTGASDGGRDEQHPGKWREFSR